MRRFHSNRSLTAKFSKMFQFQFLILLLLYTWLGINFNTLVCTVLRKGDKMTKLKPSSWIYHNRFISL